MRKLYYLALSTALLLGAARGQAQTQPASPAYALGTSQALVQELEAQATARTARTGPPTVRLRVAPTLSFTGQVNYRQDLGTTGEYLVGELAGVAGSSFQLRIEGKLVDGNIVLRASRKAYRYSADAQGNATVQEVDINKVICIDYNKPVGYKNPTSAARTTAAAPISLQSLPGGRGCILLDVDGYALPAGTGWNNGNAYNAASPNMTDANVQALWELVSEDFRPFSLNVTTDENVFNTYPKNMRMRCVISPASGSTIASGAGGVAFLTSFKNNDDTPCWVFMSDPKAGGEAASHEVGHTLGLSHDGRLSPKEEYTTNSDNPNTQWAPIMGAGYYKPVTQWSKGEYNSASNKEDDLAIMSSATYNVGYRNDDYGNSTATAAGLTRSGNSLSANGLIERTTDQDYFSFSTAGGSVSFNVNTVSRYGNLDIVARLFDGSGALIGTYDTAGGGNLNVAFTTSLAAGTYYLQIDGTSSGDPATNGYSDYASLGTYSISGTAPAGGTPPPTSTGVATLFRDCPFSGASVSLPVGDYNLAALQAKGILNNDISSLRVSSGYEVALYDLDNFQGTSITVVGDADCLVGRSFNDLTTSVRVRTVGTATLYQDCDFGGYARVLPAIGSYTLAQLQAQGVLNDDISSLKVNSGFQVVLYENDNFQGASLTVTADNSCLVGAGWNDRLSSLKVQAAGSASAASTASTGQGANTPAAGALAAGASAATALELYPNPATDRLQLQTSQDLAGSTFSILDALGRPVRSGSAAAGSIDVSSLKAGMYTLVLTSAGQAPLARRFVK